MRTQMKFLLAPLKVALGVGAVTLVVGVIKSKPVTDFLLYSDGGATNLQKIIMTGLLAGAMYPLYITTKDIWDWYVKEEKKDETRKRLSTLSDDQEKVAKYF